MRLIFGDCLFDPDTREVFRAGQLQPISPKAFTLLETADRVPAQGGLEGRHPLAALAGHPRFGSESGQPRRRAARRRSATSAREPRIIRTVARFGYAFFAAARPDVDEARHPGVRTSSIA